MELVDFRQIAEKYSFQEHAERADRYYATLNLDSAIARKPWAAAPEAVDIASGVAAVLANLKLFHGARVLDFGSGTCWLSRILALLGCEVTAVDVSANALRVGEQLIKSDPLTKHLSVSFAVASESRLPFADGSFDRIVVFDAFHHSPDQKAMIAEFHRVLAGNGIAAFHEPGPNHSRHSQSQFEMRNYDVIEGDIVIEDLVAEAQRVGFTRAELALYLARPVMVDLPGFESFLAGGDVGLTQALQRECENRRVFFLHKSGPDMAMDSRTSAGLHAELSIAAELAETGVRIHGQALNSGLTTWMPSVGGRVGSVNLGVHLYGLDGRLIDNDYARLPLSDATTPRGGVRQIDGVIPFPADVERFSLTVDLVAEAVAWFEIIGAKPVRLAVDRAAGTVRID